MGAAQATGGGGVTMGGTKIGTTASIDRRSTDREAQSPNPLEAQISMARALVLLASADPTPELLLPRPCSVTVLADAVLTVCGAELHGVPSRCDPWGSWMGVCGRSRRSTCHSGHRPRCPIRPARLVKQPEATLLGRVGSSFACFRLGTSKRAPVEATVGFRDGYLGPARALFHINNHTVFWTLQARLRDLFSVFSTLDVLLIPVEDSVLLRRISAAAAALCGRISAVVESSHERPSCADSDGRNRVDRDTDRHELDALIEGKADEQCVPLCQGSL
ncbi:hypothetical protein VTN00DRAFT_6275 [Thermoascus crustaceus]|uniref:uncharacterized protein n=1 Tax=Thermoascus crustaceus TaxID=5088 RepID=UPI0037424A93